MKTWKMVTAIGLTVIGIALVTASVFAYIGATGVNSPYGTYANGAYGTYPGGMMGGMMAGYSYGYPAQPNQATTATPAYQYGAGGCRGRVYCNGYAAPAYTTTGITITIDDAAAIAQSYVASLNNPDLAVAEVEEYSLNFYVQVHEKSTGIGAFEMLVDKYTGNIYPEQGPNMMWNTKYGLHSGIMGWFTGNPTSPMAVTAEQAEANAQQWLNANLPGTTVGEAEAFYGYYHVIVLSAGEGYGMLSVNGYTGQVWYHNWHGAFIQELEIS